jgi:methylaspartate mutase sigma subunit
MVTQEEYVKAAIETAADAVLVSSLYGHGEIDCRGLKDKFIEAGLEQVPLYIGGNLVVGKTDFDIVEEKFKKMGFTRVYPPGTLPDQAIADLNQDLGVLNQDLGVHQP